MTDYSAGFNNLNMNYIPDMNYGLDYTGGSNTLGGIENLFNFNTTLPVMPEFSSFGNSDPFGMSTPAFNMMNQFNTQNQNMMSQMWNNFMQLMQNYKMPKLSDFNFNFTGAGAAGAGTQTNNVKVPANYGNYNQKATDLYKGSAADLNKNLGGVLQGKGAKLLELQQKYGVSASLMAAIANNESAYGKSNAAKTKNNVAGIMSKESNFMKLASFKNVDDCLEALAKNLKNNYINKGYVTVSQIHSKYCPIGAANDPTSMNHNWGKVVANLTDKYNNLA